jgi:hypothetical protein
MTAAVIVMLMVVVGFVVAIAVLTAIGERRRGGGPAVAVLAGLFFPVAWAVWYSHDKAEQPGPA